MTGADVDGAAFDRPRRREEDDVVFLGGLPVESGHHVVEEDGDLDAPKLVTGAEARATAEGTERALSARLIRLPAPGVEAARVGKVRLVHVDGAERGEDFAALGDGVPACTQVARACTVTTPVKLTPADIYRRG